MAHAIHLNGGPWHDKVVAIEDGRDHIHLVMPDIDPAKMLDPTAAGERVPVKEGTYSQVLGEPDQFEWDGWGSTRA